ncbi:MAG: DoxX family membrane protein [Bacillota bacterium]
MLEYFKGAKGSWMWLVLRLYVGFQWLKGGWGKITAEKAFDATGYLKGAVAKIIPPADPAAAAKFKPITAAWWGDFLQGFAIPNVKLFNILVPWGEFLVGLALIVGFATIFAAVMGMTMNFAFLMSGSTSSNPYLMVLQFIIVAMGGAYAGYIGVDYWFRPMYRNFIAKLLGTSESTARASA